MNIDFSNVGAGSGTFGVGVQPNVDGGKIDGGKPAAGNRDLRLSDAGGVDVLRGSEPVTDIPADALDRDDALGRLVSSAFNFPPPAMPAFE